MSDFTFDPATHEGRLDGVVIPSVTQVIKACGFIYQAPQEYLDRGKLVDIGCKLQLQGNLDWTSLDPSLVGYHESFQKFLDHIKPRGYSIGEPDFHPELQYFGEFDFTLNSDEDLFDLKTGAKAKWHALQLAAYWMILLSRRRRVKRLWNVYAQADGSMAKVEPCPNFEVSHFLTCLNFSRLKERYGS